MPGAAFHSHYWATQAAEPPVGTSGNGGYVPWQTTTVIGFGFGVFQGLWDRWRGR